MGKDGYVPVDFHVHVLPTCARNKGFYEKAPVNACKIRNVLDMAFRTGVSVVFTDHNTTASFEALKRNELAGEPVLQGAEHYDMGCVLRFPDRYNGNVYIIRGEEISTRRGHILAVGIEEPIRPGMGLEDTLNAIEEQKGLSIAAHPFNPFYGIGHNELLRFVKLNGNDGLLEGAELHLRSISPKAEEKVRDLAHIYGAKVIVGSDSHVCEDIGMAGYSLLPEGVFEAEDGREIIENIRQLKKPDFSYLKENNLWKELVRGVHKKADWARHLAGLPLRY